MFLILEIFLIASLSLTSIDSKRQRKSYSDICSLDSGEIGFCVRAEYCPAAIELIHARRYPKLCGFEYEDPIVCCKVEQNQLLAQTESIAIQKCAEYKTTSVPTTTTTTTTEAISPFPGFKPPRKFIIAGLDARPLEFPHMATLGYGSEDNIKWQCAGSLISEAFVLTAAHCIHSRLGKVSFVNLGLHEFSFVTRYVQKFKVKNTIAHPEYSATKEYHDIALIELDHLANIRTGVKPACLHTRKELPDNILIATGWGATEVGGSNSDILQKVNLAYVPFNTCNVTYKRQSRLNNGLIDDWQLCASGVTSRGDTCQGDSGGPLQIKSEGDPLYSIIGITSFGIQCGLVPGVYTRVSHYVSWIESIVWKN